MFCEVRVTLTVDHPILISSTLSQSEHLCQILRNSLKTFLTYCIHENGMGGKPKNIVPRRDMLKRFLILWLWLSFVFLFFPFLFSTCIKLTCKVRALKIFRHRVHDLFIIYSLTSHYNFFCSQAADTFAFLIALIIPYFKQAKKNPKHSVHSGAVLLMDRTQERKSF